MTILLYALLQCCLAKSPQELDSTSYLPYFIAVWILDE